MKLARLEFTQHPRPPQHELRQRGVFDSGGSLIGYVENIYVDDEGTFRFVDVAMGGFMGLGKKHHLVPVEAVAERTRLSITLTLDQQTVESAPTLGDPHTAPDEGLQRAARQSLAKNSGRWGAWAINQRVSLRKFIDDIRRWVDGGRSDEWIASALGTSPSSVQSFRSRNAIYRRRDDFDAARPEGLLLLRRVLEPEGPGVWFDPEVGNDPAGRSAGRAPRGSSCALTSTRIILLEHRMHSRVFERLRVLDTISTRAMVPPSALRVAENRPSQSGLMAPDHAVFVAR